MKRKIITISLISAFSVLLWVYVSFSDEFSITLNLPTQVIDIAENHSISSVSVSDVSISLKGEGFQLAQHTLGRDPKFFIPCPQNIGEQEISSRNVLHANSWLASTLELIEISPEKITVKIENRKEKKVEIIPVLSLTYKPGYGPVSAITIEPDSVVVSGPESIIDQISIINAKGKGLVNLDEPSSVELDIENLDYVDFDINKCTVDFDVQKIVDKTFNNIIVETINIPSRYELILSPSKLQIVLRGGINQLSKMKSEDLKIFVKFEQAINDTNGNIEPKIEIPEFTSLIDVKPNRLEYIIKKY